MKKMGIVALYLISVFTASVTAATAATGAIVRYEGATCATAAVSIGDDMFVAASGGDNVLRVYRTTEPSGPLASFDLSEYLEVNSGLPVAITGATRVGDRVYWITSHGRDEDGKIRPERYRFFATAIRNTNGRVTIEPVGKPSRTLIHKLVDRHTMRTLRLDKATRFGQEMAENERLKLAPAREGLNIEALCASHNSEVLIAFRNPRPLRVITGTPHALIVPLDNAAEVIEKGEDPIFGEGILLDLEGQGIVSFEYSVFHSAYFIVAGPHDSESSFVLYRWSGMKVNPPEVVKRFSAEDHGLFPKTIVPFKDSEKLLVLGRASGSRQQRPLIRDPSPDFGFDRERLLKDRFNPSPSCFENLEPPTKHTWSNSSQNTLHLHGSATRNWKCLRDSDVCALGSCSRKVP